MPLSATPLAEAAAHLLEHEDVVELGEGVWRVVEHIDDRFAVFDAERDSLVAGGVGDEKQRRGVRMTGVGHVFGELEDGETVDCDAGEFRGPTPNTTRTTRWSTRRRS